MQVFQADFHGPNVDSQFLEPREHVKQVVWRESQPG